MTRQLLNAPTADATLAACSRSLQHPHKLPSNPYLKMGALKKYSENFSASRVAEVTISFKSLRRSTMPLSRPNSTSVWMVRS